MQMRGEVAGAKSSSPFRPYSPGLRCPSVRFPGPLTKGNVVQEGSLATDGKIGTEKRKQPFSMVLRVVIMATEGRLLGLGSR